jgi:hypothetical protein
MLCAMRSSSSSNMKDHHYLYVLPVKTVDARRDSLGYTVVWKECVHSSCSTDSSPLPATHSACAVDSSVYCSSLTPLLVLKRCCCRRCAAEVEELNHSVMAAAELLLQHAASMRSGIQDLAAAVGGITAEVQAAEQMVAH